MRQGLLFSVIVTLVLCAPVLAYDWSTNPGNGTEANPYQISTPEQLISIGSDPSIYNTFKHFALTDDIIFDPNNNPDHVFGQAVIPWLKGSLDGRGFTIENLRISVGTYNNEPVGLIGTYGDHGNCFIENLNIQNAEIAVGDSFRKVGILCGLNQLNIHNCQVIGTIVCGNGSTKIGGICGSNGEGGMGGIITHCQSDISISSSLATGAIGECGGICGYNEGTIAHCSADGEINARTLSVTGGICGLQMYGDVLSCYSSVDITAQRYLGYSGGLCGINKLLATISHSYSTGNMTSYGTSFNGSDTILRVGGFCGYNTNGFIQSCYSAGDIACNSVELGQGEETGGFCGGNSAGGEILDCFSTGDIICGPITGSVPYRERWVGGFCGTNDASIMNCYSTGAVDTDATNKAGFCYMNYDTIEDCFWDTDTSGILTAGSSGTIPGVTGKTTAQMQDLSTFLNAGWDFVDETANGTDDIWVITSNQYPSIYRELYSGGDGSPANPFQISTAEDLINLGKSEKDYYDYFVLIDDIDFSGYVFDDALIAPDTGTTAGMFHGFHFYGYLNGQGHSIDNLSIQSNAVGKEYIGLFGAIGAPCEISNLHIQNVSIAGSDMVNVGGICGQNMGTIKRCSTSGNLQGKNRVGGIAGSNEGFIYDSYASGTVFSAGFAGGISGVLGTTPSGWGHLERCYSTASVQSDITYKGGLAGYVGSSAFMKNCYWDTATSGLTSGYYLSPQFWGIIENVQGYTTSQMKQQANFVGWDFVGESTNGQNEIWRMCVDGVDYPRLSWEFARNGDFACGDGVDMLDLQALAEHWLMTEAAAPTTFNYACDANGDEVIDLVDYSVLGENW